MSRSRPGILQRLSVREDQIFFALTIAIAIIAGLAAVVFALAIEAAQLEFFGLDPSPLRLVLVPTLASLVAGFLLVKYFPDSRGSGVPQTKAAFHLHGGHIPLSVPLGKMLTGVLCVGSGHSLGREGPSVQIGAGLASAIGRHFQLSPQRAKDLVPVGAAAALSAAFNTPVAAVLFALEEIIGDKNAPLIGSTVIASVTSVVVSRSIVGNETLFRVPGYELVHPAELVAYAILGIVGGLLSLAFCKGLLRLRAFFMSLPHSTAVFQPAMGGVLVGAILIFVPQVMGVGYSSVDQALNGGLAMQTMIVLCLVKLAATIVSYSSGNAGGVFAPSLFIGAMAGGVVGIVLQLIAPFPTANPGAYALVGMGTLFAGIIRAPMTSVFMIFELTQDYQILVPLMVANALSFVISRHYQPTPVYHALLEQNKIHLPGPEQRVAGSWRVSDAMVTSVEMIPPHTSIAQVSTALAEKSDRCVLVGGDGLLLGLVPRSSVEKAVESGRADEPIVHLASEDFDFVYRDQPLENAVSRIGRAHGVLPVLDRANVHRIEGTITIDSILDFIQRKSV